MSEVKVNKISPRSGTTITLGDSGDTFTVPSGVTFDASSGGLAGTLTTAAQPNITSVGTLTSFTSTGIDDNATSTAITIDSSERVGIGETDNSTYVLGKKLVIGELENNDGITLKSSTTTHTNYLAFADADGGLSSYRGFFGYNHNDNSFRLGTDSSERMRITSDGSIGIGTSSPDAPLTVKEVSNVAIHVLKSNDTSILKIGEDGGGNAVYNATSGGQHIFKDNGTEHMRIDSSGNVGIGTSSPSQLLHIENGDVLIKETGTSDPLINFATTSQTWTLRVDNSDSDKFQMRDATGGNTIFTADTSGNLGIGTTSPSSPLTVNSGSNNVGLFYGNTGNNYIEISDNNNTNKVSFGSMSGGNAYLYSGSGKYTALYSGASERMRIDSSGNVGIGTTSPTQKLDVVGTIVNSSSFLHNVNNSLKIISGGNATNAGANLTLYGGTEASSPGVFRFRDGTTERMRIDSSGNVGINTSSPTAKLNVNGAIVGAQKGDSTPNNTDVSGVNSLTVSTGAGSQTINGLVGGVAGQVLHIIKTNTAFTLTIANQNATSPGDDIYTADGSNISLTNLGGVTLLYYNGAWYEVGK